jgi:TonB-linked SusC/RagA family outer membrane protein
MAPDTKGLEEVVVVGYGSQKKATVTGAVSTISRNDITKTPSASIQNALTGKLPGFYSQQRGGQPGRDGADFFVRGVSTFTGNQSPLILVDDIEFTYADFATIDPNEVQSISILKDAATTAVYGIKGANGVVLVTTRRGQAGTPRMNLRTEFGLQVPTHVPKFLGAAETAMLRNEALKNEGSAPQFTDNDIELYRNGSDPYGHPNINWYNTLFKKSALMSTTNLDLSGGTENVRYFVSLGYLTQEGMMRGVKSEANIKNNYDYDRYNFRANLDVKATKSLSFKLDFSGSNSVINTPEFSGASGSGETAAFYEVFNYESLTPYIYNIYNPDGSFGYANPNGTQPSGGVNNIIGRLTYGGYSRQRRNLLNLNVSGIQRLDAITKGLEARVTVSIANSTSASRSLNRTNFPSFYYNSVANTYTARNTNIYRIDPWSLTYSAGAPRRQSTIQGSLNYKRSFGSHNINALVLYNRNTKVLNPGGSQVNIEPYIPINFLGYTARVGYDFANKYLIEFNGSYNGTTAFDESHRFGFFPAVSAGWNVAEENFIKNNINFLTLFKIRGSYGTVGSDDLGDFSNTYISSYNRTGAYSFGTTHNNVGTIVPGVIGNPDVTWEKELKTNIGVDFAIRGGKISGTVDLFKNRRYDILAKRQTITSYLGIAGSSIPPQNLGVVSNKGYEFELVYNGRVGKNFGFNIKGNYSFAKNKILEIDEVPPAYGYKRQTGQSIGSVQQWIWEGYYSVEEAADPKVPKYIGSTTTTPGFLRYRDMNGDGVITTDDQGYFGKPNLPNTTIGLNTGFTFKRASLNILLQSALNYDVQVGYQFTAPFKANLQAIHLKRWTPETASTAEFPTLVTNFHGTYMSPGSNSSYWAISGNYLRIRSVEMSYRVPEKLVKKVGLQGLRVYANGYNLISWSKTFSRYGVDPEIARSSSASGTDATYPQQAIFNLGLNVALK